MNRRWESYKRKQLWRFVGWRKTVFTDLIVDAILYLGYCGEAPSLRAMAIDLECHPSHLRQETVRLLETIGCVRIVPYKYGKQVWLTETGWRLLVLMESIHIIMEQANPDLIVSDRE